MRGLLLATLLGVAAAPQDDATVITDGMTHLRVGTLSFSSADVEVVATSFPVLISFYDALTLDLALALWMDPRHHEIPLVTHLTGRGTKVDPAEVTLETGAYHVWLEMPGWTSRADRDSATVTFPFASSPTEAGELLVGTRASYFDSYQIGCATWCITARQQDPDDAAFLHVGVATSQTPGSEGSGLDRALACFWTDGDAMCEKDQIVSVAGGIAWSIGAWDSPSQATDRCLGAGSLGQLNGAIEGWAAAAVIATRLVPYHEYMAREPVDYRPDGFCTTPD